MDPFAPPATPEDSLSEDTVLHSVRGVVVATVFGSFIGAGIVMAIGVFLVGGDTSKLLRRYFLGPHSWHRSSEYQELKKKSDREIQEYWKNRPAYTP